MHTQINRVKLQSINDNYEILKLPGKNKMIFKGILLNSLHNNHRIITE